MSDQKFHEHRFVCERRSRTDIALGICVPTDSAKAEPPHYYGGLVNCAV